MEDEDEVDRTLLDNFAVSGNPEKPITAGLFRLDTGEAWPGAPGGVT